MVDLAIETRDLAKTFPGGVVALGGLDLAVERGAVYGLIGRNGAGKTTAIRLLMGLLRADRGTARILGGDLWQADPAGRARAAYVAQEQRLHDWMTVGELAHYCDPFYPRWDSAYARDLARRYDVPWDRAVGAMSGGQKRRAYVLLAFAARTEVMLLDEPAAGLDPIARRELIDEIIETLGRGDGTTILLSTHIISDLERIAEVVGIMDRGHMVQSARLEDLQTRSKRVQVVFDAAGPPEGFAIPGAVRSRTEGPVVTAVVELASDAQLDPVRSLPGARVNVFPLGLEEIFIEHFGPKARHEFMEERP